MPTEQQSRCADTYAPEPRDNSAEFRAAGLPSGGGFATARGMAAFYQMLLGKGRLGNVRLFSPRLIAYVSRNHTGERGDEQMNGIPMHRGLGPHVRGESDRIRGLGTLGAPATFGHGGVGSSYSWADPESGVSFTYLTNFVAPDPWHSARLDRVANLVHAAIDSFPSPSPWPAPIPELVTGSSRPFGEARPRASHNAPGPGVAP